MKMMTCEQMGGPCDYKMMAKTPKEMMEIGMKHVEKSHPGIAQNMKNMSAKENRKWNNTFMKSWKMIPNIR